MGWSLDDVPRSRTRRRDHRSGPHIRPETGYAHPVVRVARGDLIVFRYAIGRALIAAILVATAGCAVVWSDSGDDPSSGRVAAPSAGASKEDVTRALHDVERFWAGTFPQVSKGKAFTPIRGG